MNKQCTKCKVEKSISLYYKCSAKKDGLASNCKECDNKATFLWRSKNKAKVQAYEKRRRKSKGRSSKKRADDCARSRKSRIEMSDKYIRELITKKSKSLKPEDISDEFVKIYRLNLKLKRK